MAKFCTACGTEIGSGFAFCDECGKPVLAILPSTASSAKSAASISMPSMGKRGLKFAAAGLLLLVAGGVGVYFLARETPLPEPAELTSILNELPEFKSIGCLGNFDYSKSPVRIESYDSSTQRFLDFMVETGIYSGPISVNVSNGYSVREQLEYSHADQAKKFIMNDKLCFSDGIEVDSVSYGELIKNYKYPIVNASISYKLHKPADWATTDKAKKIIYGLASLQEGRNTALLKYEDGKWLLMKPEEGQAAIHFVEHQGVLAARAAKLKAKGGSGFFGGNPGKPLFGKWRNMNPMVTASIEFSERSVSNGASKAQPEGKISYSTDGEFIYIWDGSGADELKIKVISEDMISIIKDGMEIPLKRVH